MSLPQAFPDGILPDPTTRVLVALSGGPDSTALVWWLVEQGVPVVAAHYDHALRADSSQDAVHVAALCDRLGIELLQERRVQPLPRGSLQAAARRLRYEFLERARPEAGCALIATAHTADDVVEGVLLHLLRGSGLAGARGMPERRGPIIRPFLRIWRREIEEYLARCGEEPLRDPSNDQVARFARARVRHQLLPALEQARPGIGARIRAIAATASGLQAGLEVHAAQIGGDRRRLGDAPRPVRLEAYRQLYGALPALDRRLLEALDRLVTTGRTGDGLDLPGGRRARLEPARLTIVAGRSPRAPLPRLEVRRCSGCREEGAAHLHLELDEGQLRVARRGPGLRLRTAGGTRKLQDLLVDAKVPRHLRDDLPLVFVGDRLAWVPGIAVDRDLAVPTNEAGIHLALSGVKELGW